MIKGDFDRLLDLAATNVCAEHKMPLEVAWFGQERTWFLRCGVCEGTDAITRDLTNTEAWRTGAPSPEEHRDEELRKARRPPMEKKDTAFGVALALMPNKDLATGELLDEAKRIALVEYAYKYGLDPFRGHVVMMYGQPYIGLDGYLFIAMKSGIDYSLKSQPLTTVQLEQYKIEATGHGWLAEVTFIKSGAVFTGLGIVTYDEMTAKSKSKPDKLASPVVAAHPWQLAQKRAEWQALRRAFPIGEVE